MGADDELRDPMVTSLKHAEPDQEIDVEDGHHRFQAEVSLEDTGPFGYTVRMCPKHDLLASLGRPRLGRLATAGQPRRDRLTLPARPVSDPASEDTRLTKRHKTALTRDRSS